MRAALCHWVKIEDVISRRPERLSEPSRNLVELAAGQVNDFDLATLRAITGEETEHFIDSIHEAVAIDQAATSTGLIQFASPTDRV